MTPDFAGNLAKGAHIAVEGELRSHGYQREIAVADPKTSIPQRVWEIRVDSLLKLDRAAKRESSSDSEPHRAKVYTHGAPPGTPRRRW